jgi:hypothetical protein
VRAENRSARWPHTRRATQLAFILAFSQWEYDVFEFLDENVKS